MGKLCPRGKAAAKRKFKVYPSAYANMYAGAVCSGKVTPGGKKNKKATGGMIGDGKITKKDVLIGRGVLEKPIKKNKGGQVASSAETSVIKGAKAQTCLLYTSPSPRDRQKSRMPSSA